MRFACLRILRRWRGVIGSNSSMTAPPASTPASIPFTKPIFFNFITYIHLNYGHIVSIVRKFKNKQEKFNQILLKSHKLC